MRRLPFRRKSLTGSPDLVEALRDRRVNLLPRLGGGSQRQINEAFQRGLSATYGWMYSNAPAVRSVVDYVARNIAQLGLQLFERVDDNERVRREDHPGALTMADPDGRTPEDRFIENMVCDFLVFGNTYVLKFRSVADAKLTLVRLPPSAVTVAGGAFSATSYRIFRRDGTFFDVDPANVLHWREYNPEDPLIGLSRLETLRGLLAEDSASQATSIELLKSGLKGGYIKRPLEAPDWSEEGRKRFQESWANQSKDSGRHTPVLEEGMEFEQAAISPKDAELLAGRRFTVQEVARVYGVPPAVLGLEPTTDPAEQRKQVYQDVLPPLAKSLSCQLDLDILRAEYGETEFYFEFNLNEKLRGDAETRFSAITAAAGRPWLTVNEVRAMENKPPIADGDELTIPLNVMLAGQGSPALPAPNVMPPQDPTKPPQDGSYRVQALPKATTYLLPRRAGLAGRRAGYATEHERLLRSFFARQERSTKSKGAAAKAVNDARWNDELAADLLRLARSAVSTEGTISSARMAQDFDMARTHNYLIAATKGQAENINGVTAKQIADGADDAFTQAKDNRAPAMGMALATGLVAFATKEAINQSADGGSRFVSISGGECPECEPYQGEWPVGDLEAWPPYHANCNCLADLAA